MIVSNLKVVSVCLEIKIRENILSDLFILKKLTDISVKEHNPTSWIVLLSGYCEKMPFQKDLSIFSCGFLGFTLELAGVRDKFLDKIERSISINEGRIFHVMERWFPKVTLICRVCGELIHSLICFNCKAYNWEYWDQEEKYEEKK